MSKLSLLKQIIKELEAVHQGAVNAAQQAYNTATHEENVAENKYDTLGLEASYLAQGQSQRVAECEVELAHYKRLTAELFTSDTPVAIGALLELEDDLGHSQSLFIGPAAGGLKVLYETTPITLITPSSPLGAALQGKRVGDEVKVKIAGVEKSYTITAVE